MSSSRLPDPPTKYDQAYMERLLNLINLQFRQLETTGQLRGSTLNLSELPTSSAGLRSGDVWVDAGAANVLKKVP